MAVTTADNHHTTLKDNSSRRSTGVSIREIQSNASVSWLQKGIEDLKTSNIHSIMYGLLFVIAGAIAIWFTRHNPLYVMILLSGFYLVGPTVSAGLYDISRRLEKGEDPSFLHAVSVLGYNLQCLVGLSLILGAILLAWTGVASLIVTAFFGTGSGITSLLIGENQVIPFSGVLMIGGLLLALVASAASLLLLPLLNNRQIGTISLLAILGLTMLAWVRIMIFAINAFIENAQMISSSWNALLNEPRFLFFLLLFIAVGLVFAAFAFTISVVAVPMIIHRRVSAFSAITTSIAAVKKNPVALFRWAATIAVMIAVGMGLFFVGLALALPLIGHASWHAYRELVVEE